MKLVIGYGNTLRGDDGLGPYVADAIAAQGWPDVQALTLTQLLPELAATIAEAESVVFVDADVHVTDVQMTALHPQMDLAGSAIFAHHAQPAGLLTLAQALYGRCPPATLVSIPATTHNMPLRDGLSITGIQAAQQGIAAVQTLLMGAPYL